MTAQQGVRGDVAVLVPAAGSGVSLGPGAPKGAEDDCGAKPWSCTLFDGLASAPGVGLYCCRCATAEIAAVATSDAGTASVPLTVVPVGRPGKRPWPRRSAAVPDRFRIVLVHDAARALVPSWTG